MNPYDAIVIGAGHNGLVAAAYLAKAGLKVCVVERREIVGGACVTEDLSSELGPEWNGFGVHTGAYVCSLFHPTIIEDLSLMEFGLEIYRRETSGVALFPDANYLMLFPDAERTRAELQRFCPQDVEAYFTFEQDMERAAALVEPFLLQPPRLISEIVDSANNTADRKMLELLFCGSARDLLDARFQSAGLKAVLSTDGVIGTFAGPSTPGTAYVLLHHWLGRVLGARGLWGFVRGGMGSLTRALASSLIAKGGEIRTQAEVREVIIEDEHAVGVILADGVELRGKAILSNADAKHTFLRLVGKGDLPGQFAEQVESLKMIGVSTKINLLVSELPRFTCLESAGIEPHVPFRGTIHFCRSMEYIDQAHEDARRGRPSQSPMIECTIQTASDPTLRAGGKHVISLFTQYFPYNLSPDLKLNQEREQYADRVVNVLCSYAPNLRNAIISRHVLTPRDLETRFGMTGGHIFHGELLPACPELSRKGQIYAERNSYRTPVAGLYLCGSSAHPGGCVSGLPGRNAAQAVLEDWITNHASRGS